MRWILNPVLGTEFGPPMSQNPAAVEYTYLGASTPVVVDYAEPDIRLDRTLAHNGTSDTGEYPGFDRFGRVVKHMWVDGNYTFHGTSTTVPAKPPIVEIEYGYDKASNRTKAIDARPGAQQPLSHGYTYDGLHRLEEAMRNAADNGEVTTAGAKSQKWGLDSLGNWRTVNTATSLGYPTYPEEREHDVANQLTGQDLDGNTNIDRALTYDMAGNLRKQQTGANTDRIYMYDAWHRLRRVYNHNRTTETSTLFAKYEYNGLNWRIGKWTSFTPPLGGITETTSRRYSYSANWQLLEEWIDDDAGQSFQVDRRKQYLWGLRYIDDIVLHREDSNANGTYDTTADRDMAAPRHVPAPSFRLRTHEKGAVFPCICRVPPHTGGGLAARWVRRRFLQGET